MNHVHQLIDENGNVRSTIITYPDARIFGMVHDRMTYDTAPYNAWCDSIRRKMEEEFATWDETWLFAKISPEDPGQNTN